MTELTDIILKARTLGVQVERELRTEAVEYMTEALRTFVRDGSADCTIRFGGIPYQEWAALDLDEHRHPNGLEMKREWLTGTDPMLLIEYVADPDTHDDTLHDQSLRHDYDVLKSTRRSGGQIAFETALRIRKQLASDTLAPGWLRKYADATVELLRKEQQS